MRLGCDGRDRSPRGWMAEQHRQQKRGGLTSFDRGSKEGVDVGEKRGIFESRGGTMAHELGAYALADAALQLCHHLVGRGGHLAGLRGTRILHLHRAARSASSLPKR